MFVLRQLQNCLLFRSDLSAQRLAGWFVPVLCLFVNLNLQFVRPCYFLAPLGFAPSSNSMRAAPSQ
jgi:hypothetical protein